MIIIEIAQLENGAHNNQSWFTNYAIPEGWAKIPDGMEVPDTFPFVNITVDGDTVTAMTAGIMPEPQPEPEPEPSDTEVLNTLLGVTE